MIISPYQTNDQLMAKTLRKSPSTTTVLINDQYNKYDQNSFNQLMNQQTLKQTPERILQQINLQPQSISKENKQEIVGRVLQQYNVKSQFPVYENQKEFAVQQQPRYPSNSRSRTPIHQNQYPQQDTIQRVVIRERSNSPVEKIVQKYNPSIGIINEQRKQSSESYKRRQMSEEFANLAIYKRIGVHDAAIQKPKANFVQNQVVHGQNGILQIQPQIIQTDPSQQIKTTMAMAPRQIQYMSIENQVLMDQLNKKINQLEKENKDLRIINEQQQEQIANNIDCIVKISRELKGVKEQTGYQDDFYAQPKRNTLYDQARTQRSRRSESPKKFSMSPRKSRDRKKKIFQQDDDERICDQYQTRLTNNKKYQSLRDLHQYDPIMEDIEQQYQPEVNRQGQLRYQQQYKEPYYRDSYVKTPHDSTIRFYAEPYGQESIVRQKSPYKKQTNVRFMDDKIQRNNNHYKKLMNEDIF